MTRFHKALSLLCLALALVVGVSVVSTALVDPAVAGVGDR
jgi:hypothetical protein